MFLLFFLHYALMALKKGGIAHTLLTMVIIKCVIYLYFYTQFFNSSKNYLQLIFFESFLQQYFWLLEMIKKYLVYLIKKTIFISFLNKFIATS